MQFNSFRKYKGNFSKRTFRNLLVTNRKINNSVIFKHVVPVASSFSQTQNVLIKMRKAYTTKYFLIEKLRNKNSKIKLRLMRKILKSRVVPRSLNLFYLMRFQHKTKLSAAIQKHKMLCRSKNNSSLVKKFNYRIPYRQNYLQNLKFLTTYKLKFLIQELIQQYFALRVNVKIL